MKEGLSVSVMEQLLQQTALAVQTEADPVVKYILEVALDERIALDRALTEIAPQLLPDRIPTQNLPLICWLLITSKSAPLHRPPTGLLNNIDEQFCRELIRLLERADASDYLRTALLMNYFILSSRHTGHPADLEQFLQEIPIESYLRKIKQHNPVNLSFSEGIAPISIALARGCYDLVPQGRIYITVTRWIEDYVELIRHNLLPIITAHELYSFFPVSISPHEQTCETNQVLSWSYGDFNQIFTLRAAAELLNDKALLGLVERVGEYTLLRREFSKNQVSTTDLANGGAGLALMYHFLGQKTGNAHYQEAERHWLEWVANRMQKATESTPTHFLNGPSGLYMAIRAIAQSERLLPDLLFIQ
jgi:hypothetical protein